MKNGNYRRLVRITWSLALLTIFASAAFGQQGEVSRQRKYTKVELQKVIVGKSQEQVLKILGKPDEVGDYSSGTHWVYKLRTHVMPLAGQDNITWNRHGFVVYDPVTNIQFDFLSIFFRHGKVDSIMAD